MEAIRHEQVIKLMRAKQGDRSLREFGVEVDCSAAYLSDIYAGKRQPGPKILKPLGLVRSKETTITYAKKRKNNV